MNTMQQEFDAVVQHLFTQGAPAIEANDQLGPGCYYRKPSDPTMKCAVGCRIPDDVYDPAMDVGDGGDGTGLDNLIERFGTILPPEIVAYRSMFLSLQSVHDGEGISTGTFNLDDLASRLANVAHSHGVVFTRPPLL